MQYEQPKYGVQDTLDSSSYLKCRIKRRWILLFVIFVTSLVAMKTTQRSVNIDRILEHSVILQGQNHTISQPFATKMNETGSQLEKSTKNGDENVKTRTNNKTRDKKCIPYASWQKTHRPSCNFIHETHMAESELLTSGSYRHVWKIREYDGTNRVLKTLLYQRDFDSSNFDRHRRDAVALEQLSASPHVVNIYGYCSNSALVDYTSDGDLTRLHSRGIKYTKQQLLTIAHDVASSVADAHHYNAMGRATIVHADVKPNQFLNFSGSYMLNDFNRAHFVQWNPERNESCTFTETKNWGVVSMI